MFWPGRVPATLKLMGPASDGLYAVDYVQPDKSAAVMAFVERAKAMVSENEVKAMNRYTLAGYASTRVLIDAMRRCGKNLTWACTIAELEKTKGFESGVMGPISFGPGDYSPCWVGHRSADGAPLLRRRRRRAQDAHGDRREQRKR